ncbi:hypothetical protein E3P92_02455 [Wallemia ichthyophaga]|uniref:Uncharacterized protein n=2 Tax=Wallemia ichthyophaga TaxID=245174 RepID=A0A4T0F206_WALIC|nr:uncharacterized protein J056_001949 [Wallemia ichthyophaga EXF-994]TIA81155.1 hypothetical protein E3P98_02272 [Wallemia ichthyophaga]EOQ99393.1 hypothetical protein J056_001949 [Wallemia ichthyophaga EXF-994]TIA90650.1 hypothetical protein E3P97_02468 [Wallemia ichthyophaga]TIA99421.1 hypothetical protein E3P95_02110 [Wallemia ichthyophaga]TIB00344.1 hypothetical protein E3P94_02234 [Wallemia ichthyophaga]
MFDSLTNRPNLVPQKQRYAQGRGEFTHLKMPRSRLYYYGYLAVFGTGMVLTAGGIKTLIQGK